MERQVLKRLTPYEYQHPFDRQALLTMQRTPGFPALMRKISELGVETYYRILFTGSCLKVTGDNFPELNELLQEACRVLEITDVPELYLTHGEKDAVTLGVQQPMLIMTAEMVDQLTTDELLFVFGRQLHFVKSDNLLYQQVAEILPFFGQAIDAVSLGLGSLLASGLRMAIANWERMAQFSADRAGLLCCQDTEAAATTLIKLAGQPLRYFDRIDIDGFKQQAHEFDQFDYNTYNKIVKWLLLTDMSHPPYVIRAAQFFTWLKTGDFQRIMERKPAVHQEDPYKCSYCSAKLTGQEAYCTHCGNPVAQAFGEPAEAANLCANCQAPMEPGDRFCTRCGTPRAKSETGPGLEDFL